MRIYVDLEQNSTAEILDELARLVESNVNCLALLGQFLDSKPVIADLKVNDAATVLAGHVVMHDEPGKELRGFLIADSLDIDVNCLPSR